MRDFINLTFCGGQPGNILGGYIYNFPVSQWAGVAHYNLTQEVQLSVGVYDANPNYLTTSNAGDLRGAGASCLEPRRGCAGAGGVDLAAGRCAAGDLAGGRLV